MHGLARPVSRLLGALLPVAAAVLWAPSARADDLLVSVERTPSATERPSLTVRSTVAGPLRLSLRHLNRPEALFAEAGDLRRPEAVADALTRYAREVRTANRDFLPSGELDRAYPEAGQRLHVDVDPLRAGLYVVEVKQGDLEARALLLVSNLALVTKRDGTGLTAWAVDRASGTPRAGVVIEVREEGRAKLSALSGADGLARVPGAFGSRLRVLAWQGDDLAFGDERWFAADVPARRVYLVAHQPAYRPGERVEVRGVVRAVDGEGHPTLDPSVSAARLWFVGPGERVLGQQDVTVSADLGTLAGGFDLPKDAPTGPSEARLEIDGRLYAAPFLIDAYRAPPFEVRATAATPRVLAGQPVKFRIVAKGYDGSLLPGAPVSWSLVHHRVERELFDSDEFARLFFGTERDAFAPVTLTTGQGQLDARSGLDVEAPTAAGLLDGYLTLLATVVGPGGLHVAGSGVCGVSTAPIVLALKTDRHLYGPEDQAHVTVRAQNADGSPAVAFHGLLGSARDGAELPAGGAAFVTDARGEARVDVTLPTSGRYTLRVVREGAGDVLASLSVWAVGENATLGYAGERLDVIADKDDYAVGDTARILVLCPWKQRALLATLEGATLLDARVLTPQGDALLYMVTLTEAHVPNVVVAFAALDQGNLVAGSRMLRLPPVTRRLVTDVRPDAAELAPGATSGATLEVRDAAGQPVAGAEVSLAVVDEALHALFPDAGASLEAFFNPLRRSSVTTGGPLHLATLGTMHVDAPAPAKSAAGHGGGGAYRGPGGGAPPPPGAPAPTPAAAPAERPAPEPARDAAPQGETGGLEDHEESAREDGDSKKQKDDGGPDAATTRADFRTCVFWAPALRTGADGRARAEGIRYADSLTRWRLTALAVDATTRVGTGTGEVRTQRDLAIEVALPRFLLVGDRVDAPVLVTNLTSAEVEGGGWAHWAMAPLEDEGGRQPILKLLPGVATRNGTLEIRPTAPGTLYVLARADAGPLRDKLGRPLTDRLARSFPVLPQGLETSTGLYVESGLADAGASNAALDLEIPGDIDRATLTARLSIEPTTLAAVARALPYLAGYPHGCTEQTLSRFEPLLVVAEEAEALRIPRTGVLADLPKMVAAGVERLAALQHPDGGFGWWPSDATNQEMTARAVRGLTRAMAMPDLGERAGALRARALERLKAFVSGRTFDDAALAALSLLALAEAQALPDGALERALDTLGAERASPATRALFLEASVAAHKEEALEALVARLRTALPGAATDIGAPERWQDDTIEGTALVLSALWKVGLRGASIDAGVRWLLAHRVDGEVWRSTRDTAAAVQFLARYGREQAARLTGATFRLSRGGEPQADVPAVLGEVRLDPEHLFEGSGTLDLTGAALGDGPRARLVVEGPGAFGVSLTLSGFASGPAIAERQAGFRVERRLFRLDPVTQDGRVTYTRTPVTETLATGTLLECEVLVTTDRAREYVQVTSPYAAGFEPERERGLDVPGRAPAAAAETERFDERVEFFVTRMAPGTHVFRHLARATFPGAFTQLPARARLMYFPQVSGSSKGERLEITPAPAAGGAR